MIAPSDLGLPQYSAWRPGQWEAVNWSLDSKRRFKVLSAPTGFGKSLVYIASARAQGVRTVILTGTKALQHQLLNDFREAGLIDIRGQGNYPCRLLEGKSSSTCNYGPCHFGEECDYKKSGCAYYDALRDAHNSDLVITNYSYWMAIHTYGKGLGPFGLLVCDEAHKLPGELAGFLSQEIRDSTYWKLMGSEIPYYEKVEQWVQWARSRQRILGSVIRRERDRGQSPDTVTSRRRKILYQQLKSLGSVEGAWVADRQEGYLKMDPVWPGPYREVLFQKIQNVLMCSATVRKKTCDLMGIKEIEMDFREQPSIFDCKGRSPLIHIPTVRVVHRWSEDEQRLWIQRIDQIVDRRSDRKGILHTVSYARRDLFMRNTRHKGLVMTHTPRDTQSQVQRFKASKRPVLLVSPALTTGYDFPYSDCEYSIIGKLAFPDSRDPVTKERQSQDEEYGPYLAMQQLVQSCGRGMRSADDRHEVFIVDDQIKWFIWYHRHFAPDWFIEAFRRSLMIPDAPPKLGLTYSPSRN